MGTGCPDFPTLLAAAACRVTSSSSSDQNHLLSNGHNLGLKMPKKTTRTHAHTQYLLDAGPAGGELSLGDGWLAHADLGGEGVDSSGGWSLEDDKEKVENHSHHYRSIIVNINHMNIVFKKVVLSVSV